jgi:hypothetical protein
MSTLALPSEMHLAMKLLLIRRLAVEEVPYRRLLRMQELARYHVHLLMRLLKLQNKRQLNPAKAAQLHVIQSLVYVLQIVAHPEQI